MTKHLAYRWAFPWAALMAALVVVAACGGSGDAPDEGLPDESVARVQRAIPVAQFETEADADPALAELAELAKFDAFADELARAGVVEDDEGTRLLYAAADDPDFPYTVVVVKHCRGSDCVRALQYEVDGPEEIVWEDAFGNPIPIRSLRAPFPLRLIDPADPDGTARLAPVSGLPAAPGAADAADLAPARFGALGLSSRADAEPTDPNRQMRISSVFGQYFTWQGPNFNDLIASARAGGFPNAQAVYNVKQADVDSALSSLGPKDAFVFLTHGDESESSGRVVGMTVNADYWGSNHYPASRMAEQLRNNTSGGPGIVFLSGCKTADLIPTFDNGQRVVLGFDAKVMPGQAARVMRAFFDALSAGKTVREAITAANGEIRTAGLSLTSNQTSKLDEKLVSVGGGECATQIARNWQGTLTVTEGTSIVPVGARQVLGCSGFTITLGESDECAGCWAEVLYQSRPLKGCVVNNIAELTQFDDGRFIAANLNLVSSSSLSVTIEGDDRNEETFTREGVLTPCP